MSTENPMVRDGRAEKRECKIMKGLAYLAGFAALILLGLLAAALGGAL